MLSNSVAAACVASAYVLALVLHLNPTVPLHPIQIVPLTTTVGLYYAGGLARGVLHPAGSASASGARAVFTCLDQRGRARLADRDDFRGGGDIDVGERDHVRSRSRRGDGRRVEPQRGGARGDRRAVPGARAAAPAASCGAVCVGCVARPDYRRVGRDAARPPRTGSRAAPRGPADRCRPRCAAAERSARVTVIALDAGSLDFITGATAEGRLPNFGRILDTGAVRHLATIHPTSPEAVWAAVATGKLPQKNGVRSAGIYDLQSGGGALQLLPDFCFAQGLVRFGFLIERPHTSSTFRARTLWSILGTMGVSVGVVDWPLTQPAPVVRGFLVSDTYIRLAQTPSGIDDASALYPPEFVPDALAAIESVTSADEAAMAASFGGALRRETPARTDRVYDRIAQAMPVVRPAQVTLTRYQSLDPIGHYYLRYAMPSEFGDVTDEERRRLGPILERHYLLMDEVIGRAIAALGPDDLVLVVSGFGMEPMGLGKRLIERAIGDPDVSGSHEAAPDGFLMAYGASVARGRQAGPRVCRRHSADDPVLPRLADRARHGRQHANRSVPALFPRRAAHHLHSDVRPMILRRVALAVLLLGAIAAIAITGRRGPIPEIDRIHWVATAHQLGPVGYRDPAGALSPDGRWVAYSEGRFLRVQAAGGGPVVEFPAGEAQIRHIAWHPDSRTILADGFETQAGWAVYDLVARTRRRFWAEQDPVTPRVEGGAARTVRVNELRQPAWSPDGARLAAIVNSPDGQELWTLSADGSSAQIERIAGRISYPAWTPAGRLRLRRDDGRPVARSDPVRWSSDQDKS